MGKVGFNSVVGMKNEKLKIHQFELFYRLYIHTA